MEAKPHKTLKPGPGQRSLDELLDQIDKDVKSRHKRIVWISKLIIPAKSGMRMKFLLRVIEGHDRDNVGCKLKAETIADQMSASVRTVQRAIRDCVAAGFLLYEPSKYKDSASRFQIEYSAVAQALVDNPKTIGLIAPREAGSHATLQKVTYDTCAVSHATVEQVTCDSCDSSHTTVEGFTCDTSSLSAVDDTSYRACEIKLQLNQRLKPLIKQDFPAAIDTDEFLEAWSKWVQHREEVGRPLSTVAAGQQLDNLAAMGLERALKAMAHSLGNGWINIFEPPPVRSEASSNQPGPGQKYDPMAVAGGM